MQSTSGAFEVAERPTRPYAISCVEPACTLRALPTTSDVQAVQKRFSAGDP
jgi:hypothetical protein